MSFLLIKKLQPKITKFKIQLSEFIQLHERNIISKNDNKKEYKTATFAKLQNVDTTLLHPHREIAS